MSKSLGNVVEPDKIIKQYGADVLRLWVASVEFNEDVRMSETILTRLAEAYRKLRNTFRFALGNLHGFDPAGGAVPAAELAEIDQWALLRTSQLISRCLAWYQEYAFHKIYQAVYAFCTVDLSAVYFDVLKDRLYTCAPRAQARRSAQTALYRITHALARLLAPLLAFTTEEVWRHFGQEGSVHTQPFPEPGDLTAGIRPEQLERLRNWDRLIEVRDEVLKHLEVARNEKRIGAPLEAKVILEAGADLLPLLTEYARELAPLFIVSEVAVTPGEGAGVRVRVERASGVKCERCWKFTLDIGADARFPTVCASCAGALEEITVAP